MGGKGINAYGQKQRREMRRRNHVAKDLHSNKYHQRVVNSKYKKRKEELRDDHDDDQ